MNTFPPNPTPAQPAIEPQAPLQSGRELLIRSKAAAALGGDVPYHEIWVWLGDEERPRLDFIFLTDAQLEASESDETRSTIESVVSEIMDSAGVSGTAIRYHSNETVQRQFNGDYARYFE